MCSALGVKKCNAEKLLKRMYEVLEFILDKQGSSARGAARTALALVHAHHPDIDLEHCIAGAPVDCNEQAVFAQVQGLDNRIVRMINHATFYNKQKMSPRNLQREHLRLRQEEAALREGQHTEESEDPEHQSREAEPSKEGTNASPTNEDAAKDQDFDGSMSSPSEQASPAKTRSQEE